MYNKLFLILALCISAPIFGMRRAVVKFRPLIPTMHQRFAHSGLRDVSSDAEIATLRAQVAEIEKEVMSRRWHKDCSENDWMQLKQQLLKGRDKPEEFEALKQLVVAGKEWDKSQLIEKAAAESKTQIAKLRAAVDEIEKKLLSRFWRKDSFEYRWLLDKAIGQRRDLNEREELEMLEELVYWAQSWELNLIAESEAIEKLHAEDRALSALDALRQETEKHKNVVAIGMNLPIGRRALLKKIEIFLDGSSKDIGNLGAAIITAEESLEQVKGIVQGLEDAVKKGKEALKCLEDHISDRLKNSSKKD